MIHSYESVTLYILGSFKYMSKTNGDRFNVLYWIWLDNLNVFLQLVSIYKQKIFLEIFTSKVII